MSSAQ